MQELKNEVLRTLSFLDKMSLEMIFLDIDKDFSENHPDLTTEHLLKQLQELEKEKKIKSFHENEQTYWLKIYPKKPWWKRLFAIPFK